MTLKRHEPKQEKLVEKYGFLYWKPKANCNNKEANQQIYKKNTKMAKITNPLF